MTAEQIEQLAGFESESFGDRAMIEWALASKLAYEYSERFRGHALICYCRATRFFLSHIFMVRHLGSWDTTAPTELNYMASHIEGFNYVEWAPLIRKLSTYLETAWIAPNTADIYKVYQHDLSNLNILFSVNEMLKELYDLAQAGKGVTQIPVKRKMEVASLQLD